MQTIPKTEEEIEILRYLASIHKQVFEEIKKIAIPWTSVEIIDDLALNICNSYNVLPAFKWLYGFPNNICVSINDMIAHWICKKWTVLESWDVVSFDFWVKDKKSWLNTDAAFTMIIWEAKSPKHEEIIKVNYDALMRWISKAVVWARVWDIWFAIEETIKKSEFHLVKELSGHWIWTHVHEDPYIYNYWKKGSGAILKENTTFCLEPLLGLTTWKIKSDKKWNIFTADWNIWTHFEHMILIKNWYPEILV